MFPQLQEPVARYLVVDKLVTRKRAEFSVEYLGDEPDTLERKDCVARLTDEIKACARGGSKQTGKWLFT